MKIEIDDDAVEKLKFFLGIIIGKEIRGNDGCYLYMSGDDFTTFSMCTLEDIYEQLDNYDVNKEDNS